MNGLQPSLPGSGEVPAKDEVGYRKARSFIRKHLTRRLREIPGIGVGDVQSLQKAGICDSEELIGRFERESLAALGTATTLTTKRLAELLDGTFNVSRKRIRSPLRKHAFDLTAVFIAAALIILLFPSLRRRVLPPSEPSRDVKVTAARDIPVYGTIDSADLKVENEKDPKKWPGRLSPFVGRLATTGISGGSTITQSQVTGAPFKLAGRSVLEVPVKSLPCFDGRPLPQMVEVIFSPRDNPDTGAVISAALLAVESSTTPTVASIAVNVADLPRVSRWIGSSDAYLTLRVP